MEKNTLEQTAPNGDTLKYTEEITGLPPKYLLAAGVGALGLILLFAKGSKGKPSFFGKYITPLIMAAAYKKVMELAEGMKQPKDAEMPGVPQYSI